MRSIGKRALFLGLTAGCSLARLGVLSATASAGEAEAPAAPKVQIFEFRFTPGKIVVPVGSKVTIENDSSYTHTATHPGGFDTGHIPPGASATLRFKQKGTYSFHCELHKFMTGKIVVR
jgi:plastocyanin